MNLLSILHYLVPEKISWIGQIGWNYWSAKFDVTWQQILNKIFFNCWDFKIFRWFVSINWKI